MCGLGYPPREFVATAYAAAMRAALIAVSLLCVTALALCGCQLSAQGQNLQGVKAFQTGNYNAAATHFQQALKVNPRNPDAHYNLAALYHRYAETNRDPNLMAQAEREYQQCLVLDPNHPDCRRGYSLLLAETNRTGEAFASLKQWLDHNPNSPEPRIELARLYQQGGDRQSADTLLQQALQLDPNNARGTAALAKLREDAGDLSTAMAYYQRAYQLSPGTQAEAQVRIANLQARGVSAAALTAPPAAPVTSSPRLVNAPGPMRRF
jgi:Flp pilus assembly protein TadD